MLDRSILYCSDNDNGKTLVGWVQLSSNRNVYVNPLSHFSLEFTIHNSSSSLDSKGFPLFSPSLSDTEAALAGLMGRLVAGPALR